MYDKSDVNVKSTLFFIGDGKDCFPYSALSDVVEAEKNFSTAGKQVCSGDAFDERVNPVPDNESDVAEIYMSENIDGKILYKYNNLSNAFSNEILQRYVLEIKLI